MSKKRGFEGSDPMGPRNRPSLAELANAMIEGADGTDPVLYEDGSVVIGNYTLTPVGLVDNGASVEDWERLGVYLRKIGTSYQWLVADWMSQGERIHKKTYEQAAAIVGKAVKTLYNWNSVGNKVDFSRRREILHFTHHAVVAALEPDWQSYWLEWAEAKQWKTRYLEMMMTQYPNGIPEGTELPPALPSGRRSAVDKVAHNELRLRSRAQRMAKKKHPESNAKLRDFARENAEWWRKFADSLDL
jgi:hypothetical protein